eukprot:3899425-Rhodomonas_salina.3
MANAQHSTGDATALYTVNAPSTMLSRRFRMGSGKLELTWYHLRIVEKMVRMSSSSMPVMCSICKCRSMRTGTPGVATSVSHSACYETQAHRRQTLPGGLSAECCMVAAMQQFDIFNSTGGSA